MLPNIGSSNSQPHVAKGTRPQARDKAPEFDTIDQGRSILHNSRTTHKLGGSLEQGLPHKRDHRNSASTPRAIGRETVTLTSNHQLFDELAVEWTRRRFSQASMQDGDNMDDL